MAETEECLFSLELVVDKLYLPHVTCRFPALAFRLLDFPTILIPHVESELADKIKKKISVDPFFEVPPQFSELKDKHGNFMVKKGKSCLFKITLESLRTLLSSTPLYVMIIDNFTDVPKLLGNSTVALDAIVEKIHSDVTKVGNSIPSVHGDKGLFKVYNLMGKEIGYVILGYRLLSIGPGLIAHIPEQAFAQRGKPQDPTEKYDTAVIKPKEKQNERPASRTTGTETLHFEMENVLLQTDELERADKSIHVDIPLEDETENYKTHTSNAKKDVYSVSTQTRNVRKAKSQKQTEKTNGLWTTDTLDSDEDVIVTNIVCPPPLFYNSKKECQTIWIDRRIPSPTDSANFSDDRSETESYIGDHAGACEDVSPVDEARIGIKQGDIAIGNSQTKTDFPSNHTHYNGARTRSKAHQASIVQAASQTTVGAQLMQIHQGMQQNVNGAGNPLFPILSALLHELNSLQTSPAGLQQQQLQNVRSVPGMPNVRQPPRPAAENKTQIIDNMVAKNEQSATSATEKPHHRQEGEATASPTSKGRLSHRSCSGDNQGVPKNKSWLRNVPEHGIKKSKLTFGMTNTQRLRLAKTNPQLLKEMERAKGEANPSQHLKVPQEEFEEGNLSDLSTEIRRHTLDDDEVQRDKLTSSLEDTVQSEMSLDKDLKETTDLNKSRVSFSEDVKVSQTRVRKQKHRKSRQKSPLRQSRSDHDRDLNVSQKLSAGKSHARSSGNNKNIPTRAEMNANIIASNSNEDNNNLLDTGPGDTADMVDIGGPTEPLAPDLPQYIPYDLDSDSDELSARSDQLSHRSQKSIEVRLPSAEPQSDDDDTDSLASSTGRPGNGLRKLKAQNDFTGFLNSGDYWDSLEASKPEDFDLPVAGSGGYVPSWDFESDHDKLARSSAAYSSTGDYDTRQFHSTEEPELLDLISRDEGEPSPHSAQAGQSESKSSDKASTSTVLKIPVLNPLLSESSPVPSTRRSLANVDLITAPATSNADITPRSPASSKRPTPRSRSRKGKELDKKESVHTDSISTYAPSDGDNINTASLASDPTYSDDFNNPGSDDEIGSLSPVPRFIPSTKLGYTIG